ncbi:MAG: hypothetical protein FWC93_01685 [Defluviitaleaceae bacterium]|nr:hypothetical protein [Defluviitaleaceae bacterium]
MKKLKIGIVVCIALVIIFLLSACEAQQGINNAGGNVFSIEEIKDNTANYAGAITLIGVVSSSATQDFALQNEAGTFEILVDYRGNQALPQIGDIISATGQLRENRPCCGPGFTLTSTSFEAVE